MKIAKERTKTAKDAKSSVQDQEAQQVKEVLDMKKADMGEVITDFRKSDAPQFKGKSDKKKQQMAIAAKLNAEETEDGLRDKRQMYGGSDGNVDYRRPAKTNNTWGKKKPAGGPSALERVKANILAKHGKDSLK
jgi:hypothetical protein